jgi:peptide/nickel transport system permease protein
MRVIAHRLLIAVPVLFGVSLMTFLVLDVLPGNAARQLLGAEATPAQVAQLEATLHLDRPALERYREWLANAVTGNLGKSLTSAQPVSSILVERLPVTAELVALAFILSIGLSVPAALVAAHRPNRLADRLTMLMSAVGLSVANYVLALVLVLAFAVSVPWFPSIGFSPPGEGLLRNLRSLTLPAVAIALPLAGFYTRFLRGDLVEQMQRQDYIATALAKGLTPWQVLCRHALRNSVFGLLTLIGVNFGALIGGTVIIEQIFALPGIGQLLLQSINVRDSTVVEATVLLLAVVTVLANLAVDLLYTALDPRVRDGYDAAL